MCVFDGAYEVKNQSKPWIFSTKLRYDESSSAMADGPDSCGTTNGCMTK